MMQEMSNEERKRLSYERQNAVRNAWKEERERVSEGIGTRKWSEEEQKQLLERGSVKGYEGHHMKSVSLYPQYAGDPSNIQFLSEEEHLYGAHDGNYHNLTNGYYDPEMRKMIEFGEKLEEIPIYDLKTYERVENINDVRLAYYEDAEKTVSQYGDSNNAGKKEGLDSNVSNDSTNTENGTDIGNTKVGRRR